LLINPIRCVLVCSSSSNMIKDIAEQPPNQILLPFLPTLLWNPAEVLTAVGKVHGYRSWERGGRVSKVEDARFV
jgi:hypothetical protein